jgi:hypothetical protein
MSGVVTIFINPHISFYGQYIFPLTADTSATLSEGVTPDRSCQPMLRISQLCFNTFGVGVCNSFESCRFRLLFSAVIDAYFLLIEFRVIINNVGVQVSKLII